MKKLPELPVYRHLEKIVEEIAAEHRQHVCNHSGACKLVAPFLQYMQEHPEEAAELEEWIDGEYDTLYLRIFDGGVRLDESPKEHLADVARFREICREHGVEEYLYNLEDEEEW